MKIFKYTLKIVDEQEVEMPKGAIILDVQEQNMGFLSLWAIVDPEAEVEKRKFEVIGTGNEISMKPREYIATAVCGLYVWHIFEVNQA